MPSAPANAARVSRDRADSQGGSAFVSAVQSELLSREQKFSIENRFISLKVKKQAYLGKPAVAIYINDCTKKIQAKIARFRRSEEIQFGIQAESFTSTVSHEMRTPLQTVVLFITQILAFLTSLGSQKQVQSTRQQAKKQAQAVTYAKSVISQVTYLQSFVDDLLDLRQIQSGVF